jgi:transposase
VLWKQPDFTEVESLLEIECKARRFKVVFLPKFHCELNFIEMCWGYAKRLYRQKPVCGKTERSTKARVSACIRKH